MGTLNWYIAALASLVIRTVLSGKVPVTSCPMDHYAVLNDEGSGISACLVCDSCSPGYGVVRPCSLTENTVCGLCEMGMFSTTMSDTDRCEPCQTCQDVGMVKECSPIADAVCKQSCGFGEFYNPTTLICEQCSYCFPDRPFAQTARVLDCQRQGLHIDYQCLPLPGTDVDVQPGIVTADRQRSATAVGRHRGHTVHKSTAFETGRFSETGGRRISSQARHGVRHNDMTNINVQPSTIPLVRSTEDPSTYTYTATTSTSKQAGEQGTVTHVSEDKDSKINAVHGIHIAQKEPHFNMLATPKTGKQESIVPYSRSYSMTSTEIILVVIITIVLMLISIIITAVSCYCWLRRGKNVRGQKVNSVSSKAPTNAWAYHDMMPSSPPPLTVELRPLVEDTPPQSRKLMTGV